jgi:hypothetical protein
VESFYLVTAEKAGYMGRDADKLIDLLVEDEENSGFSGVAEGSLEISDQIFKVGPFYYIGGVMLNQA